MKLDPALASVLHGAQLQDACAGPRHLQHLLVGDRVKLARRGHDPRVGRVDARDVGVDLADLGPQRGRQGHGRRVGAASTERGDIVRGGDALEPGHDHHVAARQGLPDPPRADVDDLRLAVLRVGDHARL